VYPMCLRYILLATGRSSLSVSSNSQTAKHGVPVTSNLALCIPNPLSNNLRTFRRSTFGEVESHANVSRLAVLKYDCAYQMVCSEPFRSLGILRETIYGVHPHLDNCHILAAVCFRQPDSISLKHSHPMHAGPPPTWSGQHATFARDIYRSLLSPP
jgi:hypothetical protein